MSINYAEHMAKYLKQDLIWEAQSRNAQGEVIYDNYGAPTYEDAITIKGRKVGKTKRVINKEGTVISTNTYVLTTADVKAGDKIDGEVVVDTQDSVDLDGNKIGVECWI